MRVSTPLYNYMELIFRSKRLFIVSIVIATAATASMALFRSNSYSATALVLLSGTPSSGASQWDSNTIGTVSYKTKMLNLILKDPDFMKTCLQDAGLDKTVPAAALGKALNCSVGDNVLEISCKWKTTEAEDIVKAFYSSYARYVMDNETVTSHSKVQSMQAQLDRTDQQEKAIELKIEDWQQKHINTPLSSPEETSANVAAKLAAVKQLQNDLSTAQMKYQQILSIRQKTPQFLTSEYTQGSSGAPKQDQVLLDLQNTRDDLRKKLEDLRKKYQEIAPPVVDAKQKLSDVENQISQRQRIDVTQYSSKATPNTFRKEKVINPQYQDLEARADDLAIELRSLQANLHNSQEDLKAAQNAAQLTPEENFQWQQLTKNLAIYQTMRTSMVSRVEAAKMEEQNDRDMHLAEMKMIVEPKAEKEMAGAKSLIFFIVGPIVGLVIAFSFSLVGEAMDHTMRTPAEVEKFLNKPVLAVLPAAKKKIVVTKRTAIPPTKPDETSAPSS